MTTDNNQVEVIKNSAELLQEAPAILQENQTRKDKAVEVGKNILLTINDKGMSAELDDRCKNYLVNVNKAVTYMKDKRSSITQIMDGLKSMYTEVETELNPKREGSIPYLIQKHRDAYAKKVAEEKAAELQRLKDIADKGKEAVDIKFAISKQLTEFYNTYLLNQKNKIRSVFNSITLEDYEEKKTALEGYTPQYKIESFSAFKYSLSVNKFHSNEELEVIFQSAIEGKFDEYSANYAAEMSCLKDELIDTLPAKLEELKEQKILSDKAEEARLAAEKASDEAKRAELQKKSEEAEAARLKAIEDQKIREKEEEEKQAKIAAEKQQEELQSLEIEKQGEATLIMFEEQAQSADIVDAPEARVGYEIEILHPVGFTQIFAMWFEKVGKDLPVDKLGNTKLSQMVAWAEKDAIKNGTKIESKFIKYNDTYKAVNRK